VTDERKPRQQSQTDRDMAGIAARRERERQRIAALGVPVPVPEFGDITGQYEGVDLARARAKRPTEDRLGRLETKHDDLAKVVGALEKGVANIDGKLDVLPQLLELLKGRHTDEHTTKRHGMTTRAKVVGTIAGALVTLIGAYIAASAAGCS
jgi:hypothetical protein